MGDKESKSAWRCPTCGAWHEREGYHEMTIADQVPTQNEYEKEDNACKSELLEPKSWFKEFAKTFGSEKR